MPYKIPDWVKDPYAFADARADQKQGAVISLSTGGPVSVPDDPSSLRDLWRACHHDHEDIHTARMEIKEDLYFGKRLSWATFIGGSFLAFLSYIAAPDLPSAHDPKIVAKATDLCRQNLALDFMRSARDVFDGRAPEVRLTAKKIQEQFQSCLTDAMPLVLKQERDNLPNSPFRLLLGGLSGAFFTAAAYATARRWTYKRRDTFLTHLSTLAHVNIDLVNGTAEDLDCPLDMRGVSPTDGKGAHPIAALF